MPLPLKHSITVGIGLFIADHGVRRRWLPDPQRPGGAVYSITNGIGAGFVSYVFIKLSRGKAAEVRPMMYLAAAAFVVYFGIFYVRELVTLREREGHNGSRPLQDRLLDDRNEH